MRSPKVGRATPRLTATLAALIGCPGLVGCGAGKPQAPTPKPPAVLVAKPFSREVSDYEDFVGQTIAVQTVEIRARVTGYLDRVNFGDGNEVDKDTVLFEIDPRTYESEVTRTEASAVQAEAHYKRLEADYRRAQSLLAREALPRQDFDLTAGDYAEAGAAIGQVKAAVDLARLNLSFTKVRAPIAGRLSRRMVDPGNIVQQDVTPLTSIISLDPIYVYFDIDERTLLKLRRLIVEGKIRSRADGGTVPIMAALSDEADFPHKGLINFTDNRLDTSTGTLRARAELPNPKPRLLSPGLFMKVRLPVGTPHLAKLVPEEAFGTDQGQRFLYVVRSRPKAKPADPATKGASKPAADARVDVAKAGPKDVPKPGPTPVPGGEMEDYVTSVTVKTGSVYFKGYREVLDDRIGLDDRIVITGLQRVRPNIVVSAQLKELPDLPPVASAGLTVPPDKAKPGE